MWGEFMRDMFFSFAVVLLSCGEFFETDRRVYDSALRALIGTQNYCVFVLLYLDMFMQ